MDWILKTWNWLSGKKTYFLALGTIAYAIGGASTGHMSWHDAQNLILQGTFFSALRHGVGN